MKQREMVSFVCAAVVILLGSPLFAKGAKDSADQKSAQKTPVTVAVLAGPSGIPSAYLVENVPSLSGAEIVYEKYAAANLLLPKLIKGEVDVGFLPPNVAAKAFTSSNGALVQLGVAGNGMISLISTDSALSRFEDLRGKTVAVAGQGATPEYVLRYILAQKGIAIGSGQDAVDLDFSIPNVEIAAAVISGKVSYAVVPEPFSTVATEKSKGAVRRVFDLQAEFSAAGAPVKTYPMTLIVANAQFAKQNPQFVRAFQQAYNEAQQWTKEHPQEAGVLVEKADLGLTASVVEKAIPFANFTYLAPKESKAPLEALLKVFLDFAPESIGGALPAEDFYF